MIIGIMIAVVAYVVISVRVANWYFVRRHGVKGRVGQYKFGERLDTGTSGASLVGYSWPISPLLTKVRNPELCNHADHVLARIGRS
jgi:hypothetical protein